MSVMYLNKPYVCIIYEIYAVNLSLKGLYFKVFIMADLKKIVRVSSKGKQIYFIICGSSCISLL